MGRINRVQILYNGCFAHVFSRAVDKRNIFSDSVDFEKFKSQLLSSKQEFSFRIHHYCLMHTHFHLAVSMEDIGKFSEALKWVKWGYARYFNFKNTRFGPLWRDRFKSLLIENERYMNACGRYIERNPVAAGLVTKSEDWPYSSASHYAKGKRDDLVDAYTFDGEPMLIEENMEKSFTRGPVIGSELYKLRFEEDNAVPVPK